MVRWHTNLLAEANSRRSLQRRNALSNCARGSSPWEGPEVPYRYSPPCFQASSCLCWCYLGSSSSSPIPFDSPLLPQSGKSGWGWLKKPAKLIGNCCVTIEQFMLFCLPAEGELEEITRQKWLKVPTSLSRPYWVENTANYAAKGRSRQLRYEFTWYFQALSNFVHACIVDREEHATPLVHAVKQLFNARCVAQQTVMPVFNFQWEITVAQLQFAAKSNDRPKGLSTSTWKVMLESGM